MVSTFYFAESNGAAPGTLGSTPNVNFGNTDASNITPASNPITAGNNSYEKWIVGSWSGTFTKISNAGFWSSAGSQGTGETLLWTGSVTKYTTPVATASGSALGSIPTTFANNYFLGSALSGSLIAAGRGDWIVLQYKTTASAGPGPVNQKTFTMQWDEQ